MSDVRQISTFFVQDLFFGVEVLRVQEIIRDVTITRVPLAPPRVAGLVNLRGQIVTAIDLRRCLDLPERPAARAPLALILQAEEGLAGILVDEVGTVLDLSEDAFEAPPEVLKGRLRALVDRVYQLPTQLLLLMDTQRLLAEGLDVATPQGVAHGSIRQDSFALAIHPGKMTNEDESLRIHAESGGVI